MLKTKTTFENLWCELEVETAEISDKGILKRMIGPGEVCPMFLGVKRPGMERTFILQIPKEISLLPETIPESKGFHFTVLISGEEIYPDHVSMILSSSKTDYNDIFSSISEDLYSKLHTLKNKKEIVSSFLNRVHLWQKFFERQSAEGMSEDAQKGLYGELLFLNRYVLVQQRPYETLLRFWTGPRNRQHDFQFGSFSVEVKTTSSKQHQKLHITSEQQLDETLVEKLYLFYVSVSMIENQVDTLPAMVSEIRDTLANDAVAMTTFNAALLERGYLDVHQPKYEHTGYFVRDSKFFLIGGKFPRIKEAELRKGVGDVCYSISVTECSNYEISEDRFIKEFQETFP
ncbi:MAG: PD-(D/E)XK motif protein [Gammaproteobacteria bacterium]|nr:PD-(D/E)XK motif protein [Gammaproteobacteria bacterium]